jgi:hypothetical protein
MPQKYIIAMLANEQQAFASYAEHNFGSIAQSYLLGDKAFAHVTLVQFYGEEADYNAACEFLYKLKSAPQPKFQGIKFGADVGHENIYWVSMSVAREKPLVDVHWQLVHFLEQRNLTVINFARDLYDPHVTFARIKCTSMFCAKTNLPNSSEFILAIGLADEFGQFVQLKRVFAKPSMIENDAQKSDISSKLQGFGNYYTPAFNARNAVVAASLVVGGLYTAYKFRAS